MVTIVQLTDGLFINLDEVRMIEEVPAWDGKGDPLCTTVIYGGMSRSSWVQPIVLVQWKSFKLNGHPDIKTFDGKKAEALKMLLDQWRGL